MSFSEAFLEILITAALLWTGGGAVALIVLLLIDWRRGNLW
ncbi:MAG: hypothetical protein P1U85_00165 [Verrucomicrobiales bacterium]|nr:hypothetical protein [Verrucomicrobiales bacterium]